MQKIPKSSPLAPHDGVSLHEAKARLAEATERLARRKGNKQARRHARIKVVKISTEEFFQKHLAGAGDSAGDK